jgi:hypothetical protein
MPDPILIVTAMSVALGVSGALSAIIGWPWRRAQTTLYDAGWILGIGVGFCAGCWVLDIRPHWPPRQDLDRLLVVVLPAAIAVELLAAFPQVPRWLIWPGRLVIIAGTGRVLLHGTSYLNDLTGPGTSEWSPSLAWAILAGLAALEGAVWALLSLLARRTKDPSLSICLVVASAGAAVTVMLSGYATGGQIGLPLAAALAGATVALLFETRAGRGIGPLGVPLVVFFSLFLLGRFFGALSSVHAILLLCAPGLAPRTPLSASTTVMGSWVGESSVGRGGRLDHHRSCPDEVRPRFRDFWCRGCKGAFDSRLSELRQISPRPGERRRRTKKRIPLV